MNSETIRLQRFLSLAGVCSRREGEEYITTGRVSVNGEVVWALGTKVQPNTDTILVDGEQVTLAERHLYMFNKPAGVVTSLSDPQGRRCIADFVSQLPTRVYPVGRLDIDVRGLLLLTNDGEFANQMLHPSYEVPRTYLAKVTGHLSRKTLAAMKEGVELPDGPGKIFAGKLVSQNEQTSRLLGDVGSESTIVEVEVREGRNHFVKNIFHVVGHPVQLLVRTKFGDYELGNLERGQIRRID